MPITCDRAPLAALVCLAVIGCADGAGAASPRCYAGGPILTRLAPAGAPDAVRGWLRLDGAGDSGTAQIVETGGAALGARWTRRNDSLVIEGADDFMRLTATLAERAGALSGEARLSSDAQLDRAPDGELVPASAEWRLTAEAASCDSMPRPWNGAPGDGGR